MQAHACCRGTHKARTHARGALPHPVSLLGAVGAVNLRQLGACITAIATTPTTSMIKQVQADTKGSPSSPPPPLKNPSRALRNTLCSCKANRMTPNQAMGNPPPINAQPALSKHWGGEMGGWVGMSCVCLTVQHRELLAKLYAEGVHRIHRLQQLIDVRRGHIHLQQQHNHAHPSSTTSPVQWEGA